jgi:hypothetical protein
MTNVGGGDPVHVPVFNVKVEPTVAEPDTVGATVFAGVLDATDCTTTVLTAPARVKPDALLPATWAVRYLPASAAVETYEVAFAPLIAAHPAGTVVNPEFTG